MNCWFVSLVWECACELLVCVVSAIDGVLFVCFLLHCVSSVVECGLFL